MRIHKVKKKMRISFKTSVHSTSEHVSSIRRSDGNIPRTEVELQRSFSAETSVGNRDGNNKDSDKLRHVIARDRLRIGESYFLAESQKERI